MFWNWNFFIFSNKNGVAEHVVACQWELIHTKNDTQTTGVEKTPTIKVI